ncbi:hypothetical protein ACHAW6_007858 [Cyclotella cf. meneghiniana]
MLTTIENLVLLLNKLPTEGRLAYRTPGIKHNLVAASELLLMPAANFFPPTRVQSHSQRRNHPPRVARHNGQNNIPQDASIQDMFKVPKAHQALSIYECSNTSKLINFYYATMGYPVTSTWCKAIDWGYF